MVSLNTAIACMVLLCALFFTGFQLYLAPLLSAEGLGRARFEARGNQKCRKVESLQACEEIVLHQPTGNLYLACSYPLARKNWVPAVGYLSAEGRSEKDYVAVYNPKTSKVQQLALNNFDTNRGLSVHGMDVVQSSSDPSELFVYLVNHRLPLNGRPEDVGADSVIEIFKTRVGGKALQHIKTFEDPSVIVTPNSVVGSADGKSFYFTNDHGERTGVSRKLEHFGWKRTSVGYCHVDSGCKIARGNMDGSNGIKKSLTNDTYYVANARLGGVSILERQVDDSLVLTDYIPTDRPLDNVSVDKNGYVWAAAPEAVKLVQEHLKDPSVVVPSSAFRFSINTGPDSFYGQKYKVEKPFEDDGTWASGSTSAVYDAERGSLYMHGISAPWLTICSI